MRRVALFFAVVIASAIATLGVQQALGLSPQASGTQPRLYVVNEDAPTSDTSYITWRNILGAKIKFGVPSAQQALVLVEFSVRGLECDFINPFGNPDTGPCNIQVLLDGQPVEPPRLIKHSGSNLAELTVFETALPNITPGNHTVQAQWKPGNPSLFASETVDLTEWQLTVERWRQV